MGGAASVVIIAVRVGVGGSHGYSSHGYGGVGGAASVVIIAVRVGVRVAVIVAVSSLCFGLQRFGLEGQRLNDST